MATASLIERCRAPNIQAAYFTRGSGHNEKASTASGQTITTTTSTAWRKSSNQRARRCPSQRSLRTEPARLASSPTAAPTSQCESPKANWSANSNTPRPTILRLRAYPFTREVHDFVKSHERVYVVEQNRDAQMLQLIKLSRPA